MPSPDNRTLKADMSTYENAGNGNTRLSDFIEEPGEPKALAGGIGPLSFAGSGYGVMLVITVSWLSRESCHATDAIRLYYSIVYTISCVDLEYLDRPYLIRLTGACITELERIVSPPNQPL